MAMMCGEILSLSSLKDARVVAGAGGLNRPLRWIYVAECFDDIRQISDWIYGGELVFVSGVNMKENTGHLLEVVKQLCEKKAAGIIIYIGPYIKEIPQEVLDEAERNAFPVFELPWEAKLVTVSHDICQAITLKENEEKSLDNLLVNILFTDQELDRHIQLRAEYYGYLPDKPARICVADIDGFASYLQASHITDENSILEIKLAVRRVIQHALTDRGKAPILMQRSDSVISMIQTRNETADTFLSSLYEEVQQKLDELYPGLRLSVGIGNAYLSLDEMSQSLNEAELALKAGKCRAKRELLSYYRDMGAFSILYNVRDKRVLSRYYNNTLGMVVEYDRLNNSTLLHTLEVFLESDGNLAEIADTLFIHKNTLKYRIAKIEEITGMDTKKISDCLNLELALLIKRVLEQERR